MLSAGAQARAPRGHTFRIKAPPPGKIELVRVELKLTAKPGHRLPAHPIVHLRRVDRVTHEVVIFEETGIAHRTAHQIVYDAFFTILHSRTAPRRGRSADEPSLTDLIYAYMSGG